MASVFIETMQSHKVTILNKGNDFFSPENESEWYAAPYNRRVF